MTRRTALTIAAMAALPAAAVAADEPRRAVTPPSHAGPRNFDARADDGGARRPARRLDGQRRLRRALGRAGTLRISPDTGTPSLVARRGGFLTGRRGGSARSIALGYLRDNSAAFGLDADDLRSLRVYRSYRTRRGLRHVELHQYHRGVPAYDNVIRANVQGGRLVSVSGAPKPDLEVPSTEPRLSAVDAARRALADVGVRRPVTQLRQRGASRATRLSGGDRANLSLFAGRRRHPVGLEPVPAHRPRVGVPQRGGRPHRRRAQAHQHGGARPGARLRPSAHDRQRGRHHAHRVHHRARIPGSSSPYSVLRGDNAHVYSDQDDDTYYVCGSEDCFAAGQAGSRRCAGDRARARALGPPRRSGTSPRCPTRPPVPTHARPLAAPGTRRGSRPPSPPGTTGRPTAPSPARSCSGSSTTSTTTSRPTTGVQFDDSSGNFEEVSDPGAVGGDAVRAQADDGASTQSANFPDAAHRNNANMITPPELDSNGDPEPYRAPQMQMYLFGGSAHDVNGTDDAEIVYHEYTHGLSNRLVDPAGTGGLFTAQGGAMGEAWSDWYAADYLDRAGPRRGRAGRGGPDRGRVREPGVPLPGDGLPRRVRAIRTAPAAGSPSATSETSTAVPRCTPTARSGRRRCGTCAGR